MVEIIGQQGLGLYQIGMPVGELLKVLTLPVAGTPADCPPRYEMKGPYLCKYQSPDRSVDIYIDVRFGVVNMIVARDDFAGSTGRGIHIGMVVSEAMRLDPSLRLSEYYGVLESRDDPGLFLELEDPDPDPESVNSLTVTGIGVNDPSLFTLQENQCLSVHQVEELRKAQIDSWLNRLKE
jgi:hypothetical protein